MDVFMSPRSISFLESYIGNFYAFCSDDLLDVTYDFIEFFEETDIDAAVDFDAFLNQEDEDNAGIIVAEFIHL